MPRLRRLLLMLLLLAGAIGAAEAASARGRRPEPRPADCRRQGLSLALLERIEAALPDRGFARALRLLVARQRALAALRLADACVRLNEIQSLGTHNSYHLVPRPRLLQALLLFEPQSVAWAYSHRPLAEQFGLLGVRQIELDVFADPQGGLFARHPVLILVGDDPNEPHPELEPPGFKVLHVQDVDFETTCPTLRHCLLALRDWSDANPRHLPLAVLVELKDEAIPDDFGIGFAIPVPIGPAELDALDEEIRAVFPREKLILPDDVRRGAASLEHAVLDAGWPTLGQARGRVLFLMDNDGEKRAFYRDGHPALEGRVLFSNATPGDDDAAFVKVNDALGDPALIPDLVERGYLVRTRADVDLVEGRSGDVLRREAALASGAQLVSTDFPEPRPELGSDYFVAIPGGAPSRCNPVNGPPFCRDEALERLP